MPVWQILGLGTAGGLICGGVFFILGTWLDWRRDRRWMNEIDREFPTDAGPELKPPLPRRIPKQRDADGA